MTDHDESGRAQIAVEFLHAGKKHKCTLTVPGADTTQPTALMGSVAEILGAFDDLNIDRPGAIILGATSRSPSASCHVVILSARDGRPFIDSCQASGKAQAALEAAWRRAMADADPVSQRDAFLEAIDQISILAVVEDASVGRHIADAVENLNQTFSAVARHMEALNSTAALIAPANANHTPAAAAAATGEAK